MDAEIQFFMTEEDEIDFLDFARKQVDDIDLGSLPASLIIGDCALMFTPSLFENDILYIGKLEIRLGNVETPLKDLERAKSIFRKLRNWLKKKYFSRLAYIAKNKNNKLVPSRVHWLGINAKKWKDQNPDDHILKLSKTSWMVFEVGI